MQKKVNGSSHKNRLLAISLGSVFIGAFFVLVVVPLVILFVAFPELLIVLAVLALFWLLF